MSEQDLPSGTEASSRFLDHLVPAESLLKRVVTEGGTVAQYRYLDNESLTDALARAGRLASYHGALIVLWTSPYRVPERQSQ